MVSSLSRSGPKIFTELSPFTPEMASMTLSRMFCEKFQVTPGDLLLQLGVHGQDDFGLGVRGRSLAPKPGSPAVLLDQERPIFLCRSGTKYSLL